MKLYRGFNNNYPNLGVRPEQKGIWLTDDEDFAKVYADYFKNGAIAEVELDDNANIANEYECMSVFEDDEDWQDMAEYICDLGGDTVMDNQVCNKLADCGYDGVMFDDSGVDCYYVFNRKMIKGSKIIKKVHNNSKEAMESLNESKEDNIITAYRGLELGNDLNRREYLNFINNFNGDYIIKEGQPQWFSSCDYIAQSYGSWIIKAKLKLNNVCDLTNKEILHKSLPNFFNKIRKELEQAIEKNPNYDDFKRQLKVLDKCDFNFVKDDIYSNWNIVIDEIKKQGYDSIKSIEESEDLLYVDVGYVIWSMNNIIDYEILYYDYGRYYTLEQFKQGMDINGQFWYERVNESYGCAMESLYEGLANKPVSFTAYHGGVEPDMTPDEGRAFYLTDNYNLALQFARREVYNDGLYVGEIPTIFTYKGTFNNPYFLTDDEYDSEGQDSNIDYEKWVDMGVDGLVYEGHTTYYIVIDLSTIKLVDKKVFEDEAILDESVILKEDIAAVQKYFPKIHPSDFNNLINYDPTYQGGNELGKYGKWILSLYNNYIKDDIAHKKWEDQKNQGNNYPEPIRKSSEKLEDFEKLPDLLRQYDVINNKVKNDISNIKSISDLYSFVNTHKSQGISDNSKVNHAKDLVKKSVKNGGEIVFQDNNWIVLIPKTLKSSVVFGEDTNWCTTSPNGGMYNHYKQEYGGNYFINVNLKNGDLYQFHFESEQFMDSNDSGIEIVDFLNNNQDLFNFYKNYFKDSLIKKSAIGIIFVENPTEEEQITAVKRNGLAIQYIKNPTEKVQLKMMKLNPSNIRFIKNPTEKVQLEAVKQDGMVITYIKNPSEQVQLEAVKQAVIAIKYIKNPSEQVQLEAVKRSEFAIQYIKNPTEKVQLEAVKKAIKYYDIENFIKYIIKNPTPKVKEYVEKMKNVKESKIPSLRVDEKKFKSSIFNVLLESNILTEDIEAVKKYFPKVPEDKIQTLIELDPTYTGGDNLGKFGKWILGLYNKGQLKDEDFYKVPQYLTTFKDNLKKIQNKDIMSYKTLPDLAQAIQPYEGQKDVSKKQQVKQLKSDEAEKVLETSNWLIVHPKTHKADCYYGANTKWCTASKDSDNWFNDYNEKGPLFVLINKKNGKKYQFHFETLSFMDELDRPINPEEIFGYEDDNETRWFINYVQEHIDVIIENYNKDAYEEIYDGGIGYSVQQSIETALDQTIYADDMADDLMFDTSQLARWWDDTQTMFEFWNGIVRNYLDDHKEFHEEVEDAVVDFTDENAFITDTKNFLKNDDLYANKEFKQMLFRNLSDAFEENYGKKIEEQWSQCYGEYDIDGGSMYQSVSMNEIINDIYERGEIDPQNLTSYIDEKDRLNYTEIDRNFQKIFEKTIIQTIKDWTKSENQMEFKFDESVKNRKNPFLED